LPACLGEADPATGCFQEWLYAATQPSITGENFFAP
jgi:hypothetical protein